MTELGRFWLNSLSLSLTHFFAQIIISGYFLFKWFHLSADDDEEEEDEDAEEDEVDDEDTCPHISPAELLLQHLDGVDVSSTVVWDVVLWVVVELVFLLLVVVVVVVVVVSFSWEEGEDEDKDEEAEDENDEDAFFSGLGESELLWSW